MNSKNISLVVPNDALSNFRTGVSLFFKGSQESTTYFAKAFETDPSLQKALDYYIQALQHVQKEELTVAITYFEKALQVNQNLDDIWFSKGDVLRKQENWKKAIECFEKVVQINPQHARAWNNKGNILLNLKLDLEQTIECFDKALQIKPDYAIAWNNKGTALNNQGNLTQSLECFDKALQFDNNYSNAWNNKGHVLLDQGKLKEAIQCFEKTLKIDPNHIKAWYNKGFALMKQRFWKQSMECFEKVLRINPLDSASWMNKGFILLNNKDLTQSIECFDKVIQINPLDSQAWYNKAAALKNQGNMKQAEECIDKAYQIDPQAVKGWLENYPLKGQHSKGKDPFVMDGVDLYTIFNVPKRARNLLILGDQFEADGNDSAASMFYREALEDDYEFKGVTPPAFIMFNLGNIYKHLGQYQKSIDCFQEALKRIEKDKLKMGKWGNSLHVGILKNFGNTCSLIKDYKTAVDCFAKATCLEPTNSQLYVGLGHNFANQGEFDVALSHYLEGLEKCGDVDSMLRFNLGGLYVILGDHAKALESYKKCVELDPADTESKEMIKRLEGAK